MAINEFDDKLLLKTVRENHLNPAIRKINEHDLVLEKAKADIVRLTTDVGTAVVDCDIDIDSNTLTYKHNNQTVSTCDMTPLVNKISGVDVEGKDGRVVQKATKVKMEGVTITADANDPKIAIVSKPSLETSIVRMTGAPQKDSIAELEIRDFSGYTHMENGKLTFELVHGHFCGMYSSVDVLNADIHLDQRLPMKSLALIGTYKDSEFVIWTGLKWEPIEPTNNFLGYYESLDAVKIAHPNPVINKSVAIVKVPTQYGTGHMLMMYKPDENGDGVWGTEHPYAALPLVKMVDGSPNLSKVIAGVHDTEMVTVGEDSFLRVNKILPKGQINTEEAEEVESIKVTGHVASSTMENGVLTIDIPAPTEIPEAEKVKVSVDSGTDADLVRLELPSEVGSMTGTTLSLKAPEKMKGVIGTGGEHDIKRVVVTGHVGSSTTADSTLTIHIPTPTEIPEVEKIKVSVAGAADVDLSKMTVPGDVGEMTGSTLALKSPAKVKTSVGTGSEQELAKVVSPGDATATLADGTLTLAGMKGKVAAGADHYINKVVVTGHTNGTTAESNTLTINIPEPAVAPEAQKVKISVDGGAEADLTKMEVPSSVGTMTGNTLSLKAHPTADSAHFKGVYNTTTELNAIPDPGNNKSYAFVQANNKYTHYMYEAGAWKKFEPLGSLTLNGDGFSGIEAITGMKVTNGKLDIEPILPVMVIGSEEHHIANIKMGETPSFDEANQSVIIGDGSVRVTGISGEHRAKAFKFSQGVRGSATWHDNEKMVDVVLPTMLHADATTVTDTDSLEAQYPAAVHKGLILYVEKLGMWYGSDGTDWNPVTRDDLPIDFEYLRKRLPHEVPIEESWDGENQYTHTGWVYLGKDDTGVPKDIQGKSGLFIQTFFHRGNDFEENGRAVITQVGYADATDEVFQRRWYEDTGNWKWSEWADLNKSAKIKTYQCFTSDEAVAFKREGQGVVGPHEFDPKFQLFSASSGGGVDLGGVSPGAARTGGSYKILCVLDFTKLSTEQASSLDSAITSVGESDVFESDLVVRFYVTNDLDSSVDKELKTFTITKEDIKNTCKMNVGGVSLAKGDRVKVKITYNGDKDKVNNKYYMDPFKNYLVLESRDEYAGSLIAETFRKTLGGLKTASNTTVRWFHKGGAAKSETGYRHTTVREITSTTN